MVEQWYKTCLTGIYYFILNTKRMGGLVCLQEMFNYPEKASNRDFCATSTCYEVDHNSSLPELDSLDMKLPPELYLHQFGYELQQLWGYK